MTNKINGGASDGEQKTEELGAFPLATGSVVGGHAIPLTTIEAVWHLVNGNPIDIPRMRLSVMLGVVDSWCSDADLDVRAEGKRAYITPRQCMLSDLGKRMLSQNAPVSNGPESGPHRQSIDRTS